MRACANVQTPQSHSLLAYTATDCHLSQHFKHCFFAGSSDYTSIYKTKTNVQMLLASTVHKSPFDQVNEIWFCNKGSEVLACAIVVSCQCHSHFIMQKPSKSCVVKAAISVSFMREAMLLRAGSHELSRRYPNSIS